MSLLNLLHIRPSDLRSAPPGATGKTKQQTAAGGAAGGGSRRKPALTTPATTGKPSTAPTWTATAVVMYVESWRCCNCNASGDGTPRIVVRERFGRSDLPAGRNTVERYRTIAGPLQYAHLPREVIHSEPSIVRACPHCFAETIRSPQLVLPVIPVEPPVAYTKPPMEQLFDNYAAMRAEATARRVDTL